ncbi:MAG: hemerythrin family protein [bacterium]|nr:hemerythrin family protein [bacterium]
MQELFVWNESLSVKRPELDDQHRKLFDLINTYFDAMKEGNAQDIIFDTIQELLNYADFHFSKEEEYFDSFDYEHAEEHKAEHRNFIEKIKSYKTMLEKGEKKVNGKLITVELWIFMKDWLINHLKVEDKKYSTYFNNKN